MITYTYLRTRQMQMLGYVRRAMEYYCYSEADIATELTRLHNRFLACDYVGGDSKLNSYHLKISKRLTKLYITYAFMNSKLFKDYKASWKAKYDAEYSALKAVNPNVVVFSFDSYFAGKQHPRYAPLKANKELFKITSKLDILI